MNRLLSAPTWAEWNLTPFGPVGDFETDEELYRFIRNTAQHGYHPVGSSFMFPYGASYGVVYPDLKIKKMVGLRIVDASILVSAASARPLC